MPLAGDRKRPKTYEALASDLASSPTQLRYDLGTCPNRNWAGILADHDLVVQSYSNASQSGVVPRVHAAGRVVVVTPVGGPVEQVADGVNGIVARSVAPSDVAGATQRAADDLSTLTDGAASTRSDWRPSCPRSRPLSDSLAEEKDSTEP